MSSSDRVVTVRKGTLADNDRMSAEFWAKVPPHKRLALVWDMVLEFRAWRTPDAGELRFQRSVLRIERR
jgi:hypothetical protein